MPFAVTHFLASMGAVYALHAAFRRKPSTAVLLAAGIGGTLLDADILLDILFPSFLTIPIHRVFTHNFLLPLILFGAAALAVGKRWKTAALLTAFAVGWALHVVLDCAIAWTPEIAILPGIPATFCGPNTGWKFQGALDGVLFIGWVGYLLWKKKLKELW